VRVQKIPTIQQTYTGFAAKLMLEDGTTFDGAGFGYPSEVAGEVVFNTGMVGYTETLSEIMAYPARRQKTTTAFPNSLSLTGYKCLRCWFMSFQTLLVTGAARKRWISGFTKKKSRAYLE
jgi:hypothetical protein